jgi:hypothetical protein
MTPSTENDRYAFDTDRDRLLRGSAGLTSYAQITKAQSAGQVTIAKTTLVVNCPVV